MDDLALAAVVTRVLPGARVDAVTRLTGGVSADVYRLDIQRAEGGTTSLVLRAHGASHSGHDAQLEHRLLDVLHRGGMPVPEPLLVDVSGELLDDPYLVMRFVDGSTTIPAEKQDVRVAAMADALSAIHALPTARLPTLPLRLDPLPELLEFLPEGEAWRPLYRHLEAMTDTAYTGTPRLLHGDFWPENLLWRDDALVAILDWEDAALGDPLSDVASCRVELRYQLGRPVMQRFANAYAAGNSLPEQMVGFGKWVVKAAIDGVLGLALGLCLIPVGERVITPIWRRVFKSDAAQH